MASVVMSLSEDSSVMAPALLTARFTTTNRSDWDTVLPLIRCRVGVLPRLKFDSRLMAPVVALPSTSTVAVVLDRLLSRNTRVASGAMALALMTEMPRPLVAGWTVMRPSEVTEPASVKPSVVMVTCGAVSAPITSIEPSAAVRRATGSRNREVPSSFMYSVLLAEPMVRELKPSASAAMSVTVRSSAAVPVLPPTCTSVTVSGCSTSAAVPLTEPVPPLKSISSALMVSANALAASAALNAVLLPASVMAAASVTRPV